MDIPHAVAVLTGGMSEEEQLVLAVKVSLDTIREEQAARLIYDQGSGIIPFAFSTIYYITFIFFLGHCHLSVAFP